MQYLEDTFLRHAVSRRNFLQTSCAVVATTAATALWTNPATAQSVRSYTLRVAEDGPALTYNGKTPGDVLEAFPGESIDIHLINELSPDAADADCPADHNHNIPHGLRTTNLHTHGLHVSPNVDSSGMFDADNVFLNVTPAGQVNTACTVANHRDGEARYRFEIPADHPAGTFWYHAHKHGSTNQQVSRGLAGPMIIRDRPGTMPPYIEAAKERIFMLTRSGAIEMGLDGTRTTNPMIALKKGAVERWRIINADPGRDSFLRLTLPSNSIELWQIAFDGLTLNKRVLVDPTNNSDPWINHAALAPGNRTDFMVRVPKSTPTGEILVEAERATGPGMHAPDMALASRPVDITIDILDEETDDVWSENDWLPGSGLPTFSALPAKTREIRLDIGVIDNEKYDGKVKQEMLLGDEESWTIFNDHSSTHPFHIHVNPFFVTQINGVPLDETDPLRRWQDTIAVPPSLGEQGSVQFYTRFETFTGEFVLHCHILGHEDAGMMQKVRVV